jgi:hypothetical protein
LSGKNLIEVKAMLGYWIKKLNNDKGMALLGVLITIMIVAMIGLTILLTTSSESLLVQNNFENTQTLYVTESSIDGVLFKLKTYKYWDASRWTGVTALNAPAGSANLDNIAFPSSATANFMVTGTYEGKQRQVQLTVRYTMPGILGAASFRAASNILGSVVLDGRNHDSLGNLIEDGSGTYALTLEDTEESFNLGNGVDLASSEDGVDYILENTTTNRAIFEQTGLPETPDEVFNLNEGDLKSIANVAGNYYDYRTTANQDKNIAFTVRNGINYVELGCDDPDTHGQQYENKWAPEGIFMENPTTTNAALIIHNACGDAVYRANQCGTGPVDADLNCLNVFKGVMVVDTVDTLHHDIIGAIVGLSETSANMVGNGNGSVLYSRGLVTDLVDSYVPSDTQLELRTTSWQENDL